MASSATIKARGLDGIPYRAEINGGGITYDADRQFLVIERGESGDIRLDPIYPTQLRVFIRNVDLIDLFGSQPRGVSVKAWSTDGGDTLEFDGYMVPDFYSDDPFATNPIVEVRALDGIGTLQNESFGDLYSVGKEVDITEVLGQILSTVSGTNLNIDYGVRWYPGTGSLSSSTNPLDELQLDTNNYRKDRDSPTEGDFEHQLFVLRDICKAFGLRLRQTRQDGELVWAFEQRGAVKESSTKGDLKIWRYDTTGSNVDTNVYPKTINVHKDFDSEDFSPKHSRKPELLRNQAVVTYNHIEVNNAVVEPSFEGSSASALGWDFKTSTDWAGGLQNHSDQDYSPDATSNDQKFAEFQYDPENTTTGYVTFADRDLGEFSPTEPKVNGKLRLEAGADSELNPDMDDKQPSAIQFSVGSWYLQDDYEQVRADSLSGQSVLHITQLSAPVPAGAKLPIYRPQKGPLGLTVDIKYDATITLSERAKNGDDRLIGELSEDVPKDSYVYYAFFDNVSDTFQVKNFMLPGTKNKQKYWSTISVLWAWEGPTGQEVSGTGTIALRDYKEDANDSIIVYSGLDNIEIGLRKDGSVVDETTTTASLSQNGTKDSIKTRLGQGPTENNRSRLRGNGFNPGDWGIGSSGGSLSLSELNARERLRYWREDNVRFQLDFKTRDKSPRLRGHELVEFDGDLYRISSLNYDAATGTLSTELLQYKDYGTS